MYPIAIEILHGCDVCGSSENLRPEMMICDSCLERSRKRNAKLHKIETENALANFINGDGHHHLANGLRHTDGIQCLGDMAGAFWLIDLIASYQPQLKKEGHEYFQLWYVTRSTSGLQYPEPCANVNGCTVTAWEDTPNIERQPLVTQEIPATDFPLDSIKLYCIDGVLMLPSEN